MRVLFVCLFVWPPLLAQAERARKNGPQVEGAQRQKGVSPHGVLADMFGALQKVWVVPEYSHMKRLDFRVRLDGDLPVSAVSRKVKSGENVSFDLNLEGLAAPNGRYRVKMDGDLGEVELANDLRRKLVTSQDFKAFSESRLRARSSSAGLRSFRSYFLRHLNTLKSQLLESGSYRTAYVGTGSYDNQEVHVIRVYKPRPKTKRNRKKPMVLSRMWKFWHEGGYEIWTDKVTKLPVAVFYTNGDDNVFANFTIDYDRQRMPKRITFNNNSVGAEGRGDLLFSFDSQNTLSGISLKFDGANGMSLRLDTTLAFEKELGEDAFRIVPPFGFKKLNRDHLKIMLLTQISGGLLKLQKHGVNLKNFKF